MRSEQNDLDLPAAEMHALREQSVALAQQRPISPALRAALHRGAPRTTALYALSMLVSLTACVVIFYVMVVTDSFGSLWLIFLFGVCAVTVFTYVMRILRQMLDLRESVFLSSTGIMMLDVIYKATIVDGFSLTINNVVIRSDDLTIAKALASAHINRKEGSIDYTRRGSRIIEVRDATGTTVYRMPGYTPEDEHVYIPHERV